MRAMSRFVLALVLLLVIGACGDDDAVTTTTTAADTTTTTTSQDATTTTAATTTTESSTTTTQATTTTSTTSTTSTTTTTTSMPDRFVTTAQHAEFGEILVDQDGFTLYLFQQDTQGGDSSACTDACAVTWPPLENGDIGFGDGTDPDLFGTIERADGITQVTYNGWPLYYFSGDVQAGDTNGQGIGGNWWVVSPDGEPVMS